MTDAPLRNWHLTVLALIIAIFFFATRSQEQLPDALGHLIAIREGQHLFHPHHFLFNPSLHHTGHP